MTTDVNNIKNLQDIATLYPKDLCELAQINKWLESDSVQCFKAYGFDVSRDTLTEYRNDVESRFSQLILGLQLPDEPTFSPKGECGDSGYDAEVQAHKTQHKKWMQSKIDELLLLAPKEESTYLADLMSPSRQGLAITAREHDSAVSNITGTIRTSNLRNTISPLRDIFSRGNDGSVLMVRDCGILSKTASQQNYAVRDGGVFFSITVNSKDAATNLQNRIIADLGDIASQWEITIAPPFDPNDPSCPKTCDVNLARNFSNEELSTAAGIFAPKRKIPGGYYELPARAIGHVMLPSAIRMAEIIYNNTGVAPCDEIIAIGRQDPAYRER